MIVKRRKLTFFERLYLPAIFAGFKITLRHFFRRKVTVQYPEERRVVPEGYRGAPGLARNQDGAIKCVSCQLCEFVCPPRAIRVIPPGPDGPPPERPGVEKAPREFEIDLLRCIFCGFCQEVCPEEAIFLRDEYSFTGARRGELRYEREQLLALGGIHHDRHRKWERQQEEAAAQRVFPPRR